MQRKSKNTNHHHHRITRLTSSSQTSKMGKYSLTKRRHSHQSKVLHTQQETTFLFNKIEQTNSTIRLKHRTNTFFRPLAASTPYHHTEQSNTFNGGSPHSLLRQPRLLLTPPVCCSTPKQTRRATPNNNSHGRASASFKQNPSIPMISQRRLQFTPNSQSFVRYSADDSKRMNIKNIKIWLL